MILLMVKTAATNSTEKAVTTRYTVAVTMTSSMGALVTTTSMATQAPTI